MKLTIEVDFNKEMMESLYEDGVLNAASPEKTQELAEDMGELIDLLGNDVLATMGKRRCYIDHKEVVEYLNGLQ